MNRKLVSFLRTEKIIHLIQYIPIVFLLGHIALISKSLYLTLVILIIFFSILFKKKIFILFFLFIVDLTLIYFSESYYFFKKNSVEELRFINKTFFNLESELRVLLNSDNKIKENLFNSEIKENDFMIKLDYKPLIFFNKKEKNLRVLFEIGEIYPIYFSNNNLIGYFEDTKFLISYNIKENKLNWIKKLNGYPHHWGKVYDGKIYVLIKDFKKQPNDVTSLFSEYDYGKCNLDSSIIDYLVVLDIKNGDILSNIDVFSSIYESNPSILNESFLKGPAPPVLRGSPLINYSLDCNDTLHLNDIRILKDKKNSLFYNANPGDILISSVQHHFFIIDHKTHLIKWVSGVLASGHAHSPRLTPEGTLIYFNNSTCEYINASEMKCFSQLINFNPKNNELTRLKFDRKFFSESRGVIDIINNYEMIIQFSDTGTIIKLYCNKKVSNLNSCNINGNLSSNLMKQERIFDYKLINE